jgi:hypothetical protein
MRLSNEGVKKEQPSIVAIGLGRTSSFQRVRKEPGSAALGLGRSGSYSSKKSHRESSTNQGVIHRLSTHFKRKIDDN